MKKLLLSLVASMVIFTNVSLAATVTDIQDKTYQQMQEKAKDHKYESDSAGKFGNIKLDMDRETRERMAEIEKSKKEMDARYEEMKKQFDQTKGSLDVPSLQEQDSISKTDGTPNKIKREGNSSGKVITDKESNDKIDKQVSKAVSSEQPLKEGQDNNTLTKSNFTKFIAVSIGIFVFMGILFAFSKRKE